MAVLHAGLSFRADAAERPSATLLVHATVVRPVKVEWPWPAKDGASIPEGANVAIAPGPMPRVIRQNSSKRAAEDDPVFVTIEF